MPVCKDCGETYPGADRKNPTLTLTDASPAEGEVVLQGERILHACPTVTRAEQAEALQMYGSAMFEPPPEVAERMRAAGAIPPKG